MVQRNIQVSQARGTCGTAVPRYLRYRQYPRYLLTVSSHRDSRYQGTSFMVQVHIAKLHAGGNPTDWLDSSVLHCFKSCIG